MNEFDGVMTTAQLIEAAKAKVTEAMTALEEALRLIGAKPTDEPTDADSDFADLLCGGYNTAYYELYKVVR